MMNVKCKGILLLNMLAFFIQVANSFGQGIKSVKIDELGKIIAESKTPMIINFFATWCKPCLEELPYFLEEYNKHKKDSLHLLLVSMDFKEDYEDKVKTFAQKRKITAPILWLDETNADIFCPRIDSTWTGAIPATLFINNKAGYRQFYEGQLSHEKLKKEIMAILDEQ